MSFEAIAPISTSITPISGELKMGKSLFAQEAGGGGFDNVFAKALGSVNDTMMTAKEIGDKAATGEVNSIHQMSIAGMKSEVMLKLTTQIAAKLSSATSTLFQMQM